MSERWKSEGQYLTMVRYIGAMRDYVGVPVRSHGVLYGDGIFEGIRFNSRGVEFHGEHYQRLRRSAVAIAIDPPPRSEYDSAIRRAIELSKRSSGYIRFLLLRGLGDLGIDPVETARPINVLIVGPLRLWSTRAPKQRPLLAAATRCKPSKRVWDWSIKSCNYIHNIVAKIEARRRGADDAIQLTESGHVSETTVANLFSLRGRHAMTPSVTTNCLPGITRAFTIELLGRRGVVIEQGEYELSTFARRRLLIQTGTGAGIAPAAGVIGFGRQASDALTERIVKQLMSDYAELSLRHSTMI